MRKSIVIGMAFVAITVFCFGSSFAGATTETPNQTYFDKRFDALEKASVEIKGDTSQIISILGDVFEGTVPAGGTLIKLCNEKGWNLIVVMGHNGIENPNIVAAGACFTYPQTSEEFQQALKKGKPLYQAWLKKQSIVLRVNRIKVDTAEIEELSVRVATFKEKLAIKDMQIDQLKTRLAEITEKLSVEKAEIDELNVRLANFNELNINKLSVKDAEIENLRIQSLEIKEALIEKLRVKQLEIDNLCDLLKAANCRIAVLEKTVYPSEKVICVGGGCDERAFTGNVPDAVLKVFPNGSDALELHERPCKSMRFKVKRIRVGTDGVAHPVTYEGDCMRIYSENELTQSDLMSLLVPGEALEKISYRDGGGNHKTIAVYAIIKEN